MSKTQQPTGRTDSTTTSDARQTDVGRTEPLVVEEPSDDELFELLANQRRRFVLHYLDQHADERVSLSTLSEHVAGWEHGVDAAELDYRERKSVRNSLHQFHLPKLSDAGVIEYHESDGEVEVLNGEVVKAYHVVASGERVPWTAYVVGAAVGAVAVLALVAVGVLPGASPVAWVLAIVAAMIATGAHYATPSDADDVVEPPECDA